MTLAELASQSAQLGGADTCAFFVSRHVLDVEADCRGQTCRPVIAHARERLIQSGGQLAHLRLEDIEQQLFFR